MGDYDGLLVPRPVHTAGQSKEEGALAWAFIIQSGHIPLRTRLGTCNRDLYRPLRRRHLKDLYNVWTLIQANRG